MDLLTYFLLACFSSFYLVSIFLWSESGENGPFPDKTRSIIRVRKMLEDSISEYRVRVVLFDWVRRFFGLYDVLKYTDEHGVKTETWLVREERIPVWLCPRCLSFWVSLIVCTPYIFIVPLWVFPIFVIAVSGGAFTLWWIVDYLYINSQTTLVSGGWVLSEEDDDDGETENIDES